MADILDPRIGANIREKRIAAGMTQAQIGEVLGVTFQQIQKYESGRNRISGAQLYRLAWALPCNISDFYNGLDDKAPAARVMQRDEIELLEGYRKLSPNMQTATKGFIFDIINHAPTRRHMEQQG